MKPGMKFLPEGFRLTEATRAWVEAKCPTVDIDETFEVFVDKAAAKAWAYRDWQAAFRNYVRNGQKYGGLVFRNGRFADPRWSPVIVEAQAIGFREPMPHETPDSYRTAMRQWRPAQNVIPFGNVLKRMP
jgi:hypothetical protein